MTAQTIAAELRERAAKLMLDAQAMEYVAEVLDPKVEPIRKPRTRRPAKRANAKKPRGKAAATLRVQTIGTPESELDGRKVAHVTSE